MKCRKATLLGMLGLTLALGGCMASAFVQTGKKLSPLPDTATVTVVEKGKPAFATSEVGVVAVSHGSYADKKELAQQVARANGGDVLVLLDMIKASIIDPVTKTQAVRVFEVLRKQGGGSDKAATPAATPTK